MVLLASCESPFAPRVTVVSRVEITPNVLQLVVGGTANLDARVYGSGDALLPTAEVFWSSQNPAIVSITQDGVATAVASGTTQIAASSGGQSRTIAVTVEQRPIALIRVLPSAASVVAGTTLPLQAEALDGGGNVLPNRAIEWSSEQPDVAAVSSQGVVTGVAVGVATISATAEGKVGSAVITVVPAPIASITVQPDGGNIPVGSTLQLDATPRDAAGQPLTGRNLTWQSSNNAVATVSSAGLVSAISAGSVTITVSAPGGGAGGSTPSASVTVVVQLAPVASAVIVPSPASVQVGQAVNLTVNLFGTGGVPLSPAGRTIDWSSSNQAVATVSQQGVASGVAVGSATITAAITTPGQANAVLANVTLTVSNQPVASVEVTPGAATVHAGELYARVLTATTKDGQGQVLNRSVVWTSANQSIATVDAVTGVVTGVSPGVVQIRATSEGVEGTATITVDLVAVSQVEVTPPALSLTPPDDQALSATPRDSAGNAIQGAALGGRPTGWTSSNAGAATVSTSGVVTAVAEGVTTVSATIGGTTGQSSVTVTAVPIASITVAPGVQTITLGTSIQLVATAFDGLGGVLSGRPFTWQSATPAIVSVDQSGLVTALAVGGAVTITASAEGKSGSAQITVVPRPAAKLAIATQPASVAQSGVPFAQQPAIQLVDDVDVPVQQMGVVVTASIASGTGTLDGTVTATTNAAGVATFTDLAITGAAGAYTIGFAAPSLAGVTSSAVIVGAGGASQLAIVTQPSPSAQNAVPFVQQPVVRLLDAANNPVALAGVSVTASIASGTGTLGGTATVSTDASGIATFTNLSITGVAGPFTLAFATAGLTGATSDPVTLSPGAAAALAIVTQPSPGATNGQVLTTQPVVRVLDSGGNPVAGAGVQVTAALTSGGATLGGTVTVATDASGVATFTNLVITGTVGTRALEFTSAGLAPVTSTAITLGPGAATQLAILTQPSAAPQNDMAFPVQPVLRLRDASGNDVAQAGVVVTAAIATGSGTLGGTLTATTDGAGTASFTNLRITGPVGIRTLAFSAPSLTGATSANVNLLAGVATQLALTQAPPGAANSGEVFTTPTVVRLRDVSGNDVPQSGVQVTAVIQSGAGGSLSGGAATTDGTGAATFVTLTLTGTAGNYVLSFGSGALPPVLSGTIVLSAGTGSKLALSTAPSSTVQNAIAFPTQPAIQLQDASGNPVNLAGVQVFAVIASGGGTLGGTTSAMTNGSGVASFTDLSITGTVGDRTLLFTASGYLPVSSGAVTVTAGTATNLVIATQPSATVQNGVALAQQPVILVRDLSTNPVAGVVVTAAIASGGGSLGGTLMATSDASGLATFTNLAITGLVGNRTLSFTIPGPISVTSNAVAVTAGAPATLTIAIQPSASVANDALFPQQPAIQVNDASGNGVPGIVVTAAVATGAGTLGGTLTATTSGAGTATFTNLKITGAVGDRTLSFTAGSLSATSTTVTVTVGAATSLAVTQQPTASVQNDAAFPQQPAVQITDISGNPLAGVVVTASIATGAGTLGGTLTATTNASGIATFTNLMITGLIGDRTLGFAGASLSANSNTVTVTPGAVTQLSIVTQPSSAATNGVAFPQQPVVRLQDVSGNNVLAAGTVVTASVATGAGTLGGTLTATTDASGIATFTNLMITGLAGDRTLSFGITVPAAISVTSGTVTVSAGAPAAVTITTQPSVSAANDAAFPQQPVVVVSDASTNPVPGVVVTASIATGAGTLGGTLTATTDAAGTASFTNLKITGAVGDRTLSFAVAGPVTATSNTISVTPGAASSLTITTPPSSPVVNDAAFVQQPVIQVNDVSGNGVPGVVVTASVATGAGTLGGTLTATTDAGGTATFVDLKLTGTAGDRTLSFTGAALSATSGTVSVTPGAVTQLAIVTQPSSSATNGVAFPQQPVVRLQDVSGNNVATAGITVTAALASGAAALGGDLTMDTDAAGVATFADLVITGTPGDRTISFTIPGPISVTSATVSVGAGAAASVTISTAPSASVVNDVAFPQQPVIQVDDASANGVPGVVVTAAIATGAGTLGGTLTATTNASGTATFTDLRITGPVGDRTLSFSVPGPITATSGTVSVVAGAPTSLTIATPPSGSVQNDVDFPVQPAILLTDVSGNPIAGTVITAAIASGAAALGGTLTATTDGTGTATYTNLRITGLIGDRTLSFTAGLLSATSGTISVTPGVVTQLAVIQQPSANVTSGVPFPQQPAIRLRDVSGNNAPPSALTTVTASISSGGGTLGGTTAVDADGTGLATFTDLSITGSAGDRELTFSVTVPGNISVASGLIAVSAGAAASVTITTQPSASVANDAAFAQQPVIQVNDASAVGVPGVVVTAAIASGAGMLGGTLTATTDATGAATFTNLKITGVTGDRTLSFTVSGPISATSSTVTVTPGSATSLIISTQPSASVANDVAFPQQPVIQLNDVSGNGVPGVNVTATIASGGAALGGTTIVATDGTGAASFTDLKITGLVGDRTLQFSGASLSGTSNTVSVTFGSATQLTITTQPSPAATNDVDLAQQPVIQLRDISGNAVAQSSVQVDVSIASGPGVLGGTTSITTDVNGVATYSGLRITGTIGDRTLEFTSAGLTPVTSGTITVAAGAATQIAITQQPSAAVNSDEIFPQQPIVRLLDVSGNLVLQSGVTVTVTLASGTGTLNGTTSVNTDGNGIADFAAAVANLSITGTGSYTLQFSSGALTPAVSNAVVLP